MLILSQNKSEIVNLNNVTNMFTYFNDKIIKCMLISGGETHIGEYETEERAKEVLQEIIKHYNLLKKNSVYAMGDSGFIFEEKFYYEMPEK